MKFSRISAKVLLFLLMIFGPVLVESTDRSGFLEVAFGEYDLISRVGTSVFDDFSGYYKIGAMVRIDVFGNFPTVYFDYGTVQVTSASLWYSSSLMNLSIAEDGVNFFAFWDTTGLSKANDYVVSATLADKSGRETTDSDTVVALSCDPVFKNVLVSVADVSFLGRGLSINLVRSFHIRSGYEGVFGYGWTHSYNVRLIKYPDGSVRVHEGDGSNSWFQVSPSGGYTSPVYMGKSLLPASQTGGFERKYRDGLIERFDSSGKLERITDPNGNSMTLAYDGWLLTRIIDPAGHTTYLGYNDKGRISSITDPAGRMTLYEYDTSGNLVSATDPAGGVTKYAYDSNHNLISITDAEGRNEYFEYDLNDRLVSEYYEGDKNKIIYLYDENEPSVTVEDALGHQTTFIYGENNELVDITDALGNTQRFYYDANYNLMRYVDANGHEACFTYDARGNVLTSRDALGGVTSFMYEERFNEVTSITDALGRKTAFNYDDKGNLRQITYPNGSTEKYGYDELGNLISKTDRKGQTISYLYDANGWLVKKIYPDQSDVVFTYDVRGNLIRAADDNGEISYEYDYLDRITRVSYPGNNIIEYRYDVTGNRVQMVYPDGSIMKYVYDEANQLILIKDSQDYVIVNYTYDEAGRRIRKELENGVYTTYSYDAADQLTKLVNKKSNGDTISSFSYTHDPRGNRLTMTTLEGTHYYSYDANYQLVRVSYSDGSTTTYSYDALGNRVSITKDGTTITYVTNDLNQYISFGGTSYAHDANGNMVSKTEGGQTTTYQYNFEDMLTKVISPEGTLEYIYDAFRNRICGVHNGMEHRYLVDPTGFGDVVAEYDGNGNLISRYIYGLGLISKIDAYGNKYYYDFDPIGHTMEITNEDGYVVNSYKYSPFGMYLEKEETIPNPFGCVGEFGVIDDGNGLNYMRMRYYQSELGRFLSEDPIGYSGGVNLYKYCSNNPIRFVDPTGEKFWWEFIPDFPKLPDSPPERLPLDVPSIGDLFPPPDPRPPPFHSPKSPRTPVYPRPGILPNYPRSGPMIPPVRCWGPIMQSDPTFIQPPKTSASSTPVIDENLGAQILIPYENSLVRGSIPIFGLAYCDDFEEYRLEYGEGEKPKSWIPIVVSQMPQTEGFILADLENSADTTIIGNLGNWDTGLKNYVYMPTYPPDHSIDLNGVYTLRLVVTGKNGETVEDRVTVEVGRVIPNAFGGTALSRDRKVILTVPEQSTMDSFRIISIKPIEKSTVSIDPLHKLIGDIYEFREPGEKFTKTATLQMQWSNKHLQGFTPSNLGIYTYNPETRNWQYLPTERIEEENTLITTITQITPKTAYYAILASNSPNESSKICTPPPAKPKPQENTQDPYLFLDTFENSLDEWSNRDEEVGATLSLDNTATPDGTYCLKLTNKKRGGNFASNVRQTPFDAKKYPIVSFDYKIPSNIKINFLVKVSGRWYDIQFTDDPKEYRYKRVNIAGIGKIQGITADNNWNTAEFNLYEMLRTKTRNHIVEAMIMADWDIMGYMKLEFGHNHQGAIYYIDNFSISKDPQANNTDNNPVLIIDDFNNKGNVNLLKGSTFTFSDNQGLGRIQKLYYNEQPFPKQDEEGYSLHLSYDISQQNAYAGYVTMLNNIDLTEYQTITFWIKGKHGKETLLIGLRDQPGHESKLLVDRYLVQGILTDWQKVTIPLTAFTNIPHWKAIENLNLCLESWINRQESSIYIDDLQFEKTLGTITVEDFESQNGRNLFGGNNRIFTNGNCTINVAYETSNTRQVPSTVYCISYSGEFGPPNWAYSGWATELNGVSVSVSGTVSFYIKGAKGGETSNIYLDDGTNRACVDIEKYVSVTTGWQKVTILLSEFSKQGVDLTNMQEFQIAFEWENMSGAIWIDNIQFTL